MQHLLIVGARGYGREAYETFRTSTACKSGEMAMKGFLDSNLHAFDGLNGDFPPILCSPEEYIPQQDDVFFIAMGDPKWRKHYADLMQSKGAIFASIISKSAKVFPTVTISSGAFIGGWTCISDNVVIGSHAAVMGMCTLGHDCKVGAYSMIESYSFMGGYSEMGEQSIMHVRSTLIRHKKIGNHVEVGSSSVVMRNVKDGLHVWGNPAKRIDL